MEIDISYDVSKLEAVIKKLENIEKKFLNPAPLLEDIGMVMVAGIGEAFQRETSPEGIPWEITQRKKKNPASKILRDKGKLAQSVGTYKVKGNVVSVGSKLKYASVHQNGFHASRLQSTRAAGYKVKKDGTLVKTKMDKATFAETIKVKGHEIKIPARPFVGYSPRMKEKIRKLVREYAMI